MDLQERKGTKKMKWTIREAKHWSHTWEEEINSLEDLEKLAKEFNDDLIINFNDHEIIIYNYYIE